MNNMNNLISKRLYLQGMGSHVVKEFLIKAKKIIQNTNNNSHKQ